MLEEEDRNNLSDIDDFDILMSILNEKSAVSQKISVELLLALLFPGYIISITETGFQLKDSQNTVSVIDKNNYNEFKEIISAMFQLNRLQEEEFNPINEAARKIAEKIKKGREKRAAAKGLNKKFSIFSRYVSILAVGLQMDMNIFLNHTVYQLYNEFERFQKYLAFDINIRARLAGATEIDDVENWMEDIHS